MGGTILEVVLGALIAIFLTIVIENMRRPHLEIRLADHHDNTYPLGGPATNVRFMAADLVNKPLPWAFRWMSRDAALHCHGSITFHHLDGQNVFARSMPIRWSSSAEPIPIHLQINNTRVLIADPAKLSQLSGIDVHGGESQRLDVAAKFDNDTDCYGWSNESHFSNPVWRNPDWKLPSGRYLV